MALGNNHVFVHRTAVVLKSGSASSQPHSDFGSTAGVMSRNWLSHFGEMVVDNQGRDAKAAERPFEMPGSISISDRSHLAGCALTMTFVAQDRWDWRNDCMHKCFFCGMCGPTPTFLSIGLRSISKVAQPVLNHFQILGRQQGSCQESGSATLVR